jgi:hypothetical protein
MIAALIAYGAFATVLLVILFVGAKQLRASEQAAAARDIARLDGTLLRYEAMLHQRDEDHRVILARRDEQHVAEIERLNAVHVSSMERLMNMQSFGTTTPKEAAVTEQEPDAETRLLRGVTQDMINHGAAVLQAEYEKRGVIVSIEELRDEAHSMILGVGFTPKTDRHLAVRD